MDKEQALAYCYKHKNQYIADCHESGENGQRLFDCLVAIVEDGTIHPDEIKDYGMDYDDPSPPPAKEVE